VNLGTRILTIIEGVGIALDAIRANKVRAALTIAGVAIGVFVVVAMSATIHGVTRSFKKDLDEWGATTFTVRRRDVTLGGCDGTDESCPDRKNPPLTLAELEAIKRLPSVQVAGPVWFGSTGFHYADREENGVSYDAFGPQWLETDGGDIYPGRNFSAQEYADAKLVVIINDTLRTRLFKESDPIGKQVTIEGKQFTVIGIYHTTAGFLKSMDGRGPDKPHAIIPFETARRHLDFWVRGMMIMVKPRAGVAQSEVMDDVTAAIRGHRGLRPSQPNNFALVGQDRILDVFNQLFGAIFLVMLALSAVGLLVGGVGVVAIMMISVTERTREIGVRKALGATKATILWQFLVEAATLTSIGAALGLAGGALVSLAVRSFTSIPASVPAPAVAAALAASALTGIVCGLMPAARAARLDPGVARRYE
jgi:putative ABC transport system permease protein